jgi:hypothetical protein
VLVIDKQENSIELNVQRAGCSFNNQSNGIERKKKKKRAEVILYRRFSWSQFISSGHDVCWTKLM